MVDQKIKIKYKEAPGYRHVTATGVFGGPILTGDLLCNFFLEHRILPDEINIIPSDPPSPKAVEEAVYSEGKDVFIRELQIGIVMNPPTAKAVGEWLIKRAEGLMKIDNPIIQ